MAENWIHEFTPEVSLALLQLSRAYDYTRATGVDPWEFAVEIERLLGVGVTTSDLRWLVLRGYVVHARELTASGDSARRFEPQENLALPEGTCFLLTGAGLAIAREQDLEPAILPLVGGGVAAATDPAPRWDRQLRTLYLGDRLVKRYRVPAGNQEAVLSAFEQEGWARVIDDPLPHAGEICPGMRLRDTLRRLNANQTSRLLRFSGDGSGKRVLWEMLAPPVAARQPLRRAA